MNKYNEQYIISNLKYEFPKRKYKNTQIKYIFNKLKKESNLHLNNRYKDTKIEE